MIVSKKYNFIFIEIPKTGTTSIREKLLPHGLNEMQTKEPKIYRHTFAWGVRDAVEAMGFKWKEMFKFAFVRNPWDRCISTYHDAVITDFNDEAIPPKIRNWRKAVKDGGSFEAYAKGLMLKQPIQSEFIHDYRRRSRYLFRHNKLQVDFVGRFENLQNDFDRICEKIGMPKSQLAISNKSHDPSTGHQKKHYSHYYNAASRELVAKKYEADIKKFGYAF